MKKKSVLGKIGGVALSAMLLFGMAAPSYAAAPSGNVPCNYGTHSSFTASAVKGKIAKPVSMAKTQSYKASNKTLKSVKINGQTFRAMLKVPAYKVTTQTKKENRSGKDFAGTTYIYTSKEQTRSNIRANINYLKPSLKGYKAPTVSVKKTVKSGPNSAKTTTAKEKYEWGNQSNVFTVLTPSISKKVSGKKLIVTYKIDNKYVFTDIQSKKVGSQYKTTKKVQPQTCTQTVTLTYVKK